MAVIHNDLSELYLRPPKRKKPVIAHGLSFFDGAEGETRTRMTVRSLDPEPSVSTSSTTSATAFLLSKTAGQCNRIFTKTARGLFRGSLSFFPSLATGNWTPAGKFARGGQKKIISFFAI